MTASNPTLNWYKEMGVTETIDDSPRNHFVKAEMKKTLTTNIKNQESHETSGIEKFTTLEKLEKYVKEYKEIGLTKTATNTVFSDGNKNARIMCIGEAPGADEDIKGIPFCGASGKLLDIMFSHIGLLREKNIYITNVVFWRPPGNRRPTNEELAICLPMVEKHIALIKPKLIILIGGTAISSLLNTNQGITKMRGQFLSYKNKYMDQETQLTAIFHPSYLLRSPGQKKLAWKDLLTIERHITENKLLPE